MDLQIQILRRSSNHRQRCYQINDKKCTIIFTIKRAHIFQTPQNQCHQPTHIIHYRASYRLYIIVYITSDLIYSRTKIVIVLASEMLCFLPKTTRLVLHHVPAKAKIDAFRFYLQPILCPIFRLFSRTSSSQILRRPYSQLKMSSFTERRIYHFCHMSHYDVISRVTCDES